MCLAVFLSCLSQTKEEGVLDQHKIIELRF